MKWTASALLQAGRYTCAHTPNGLGLFVPPTMVKQQLCQLVEPTPHCLEKRGPRVGMADTRVGAARQQAASHGHAVELGRLGQRGAARDWVAVVDASHRAAGARQVFQLCGQGGLVLRWCEWDEDDGVRLQDGLN